MSRQQWLKKLEKELKKLPQEERDDALIYYGEYLEEIPEEQWEEASKQLGSPGKVAAQIKSDYAITQLNREEKPGEKKSQKTTTKVGWILLAVFGSIMAAPVAIPVVILLIAVAGSIVAGVIGLIIGWLALLIGLVAGGIGFIVAAVVLFGESIAAGLLVLGCALMMMVIGVVAFAGTLKGLALLIGAMGRGLKRRKDRKSGEKALQQQKLLEQERGDNDE